MFEDRPDILITAVAYRALWCFIAEPDAALFKGLHRSFVYNLCHVPQFSNGDW